MTKAKARKRLGYALEDREFWREKYVENERNKREMLDVNGLSRTHGTLRKERRAEAIQNIREANERIARLERIAK